LRLNKIIEYYLGKDLERHISDSRAIMAKSLKSSLFVKYLKIFATPQKGVDKSENN
jgi:hypothetical protein